MPAKLLMFRIVIAIAAVAVCAALFLAPVAGQGQAPTDEQAKAAAAAKAAKAKRIAQEFERDALVLTVFDRQGKVLTMVGERGLYLNPVFSPDRTRLAVWKNDLERETEDLWVLDVATGTSARITANQTWGEERVRWPVWSPDGRQLAYVALRNGRFGLYRTASTGVGTEELLYQHTGRPMFLLDWSMDGRFYVRPFDASKADVSAGGVKAVQVSTTGALGMIFWRQDGRELYYLTPDWEVMAVDVTTTPTFQAGTPRLLFKLPGPLVGNPQQSKNVSRDGQRFVFAINVPVSVSAREVRCIH